MELQLLGPHPFARDPEGRQLTRIGTLFPTYQTLYTDLPGVHAWQRFQFIDYLNGQRLRGGLPALSREEEEALCGSSVDLVFEVDHLLIRADPEHLDLAFAADELLQGMFSKRQIKFLSLNDLRLRLALKKRGEYWRLSSLPSTREAKEALVFGSKVAIGGQPIYYYNRLTGTRWLTLQEFDRLGTLEDVALAKHLQEISDYSEAKNRMGRPELACFAADLHRFGAADFFSAQRYDQLSSNELRAAYTKLQKKFRSAVRTAYRRDDFQNNGWAQRMLQALFLEGNEAQTEQILSGLSPEFFMQVEWLPGGRFEEGEFLLDTVFEDAAMNPKDVDLQRLCDHRAKEIILNFTRDYGDLEYINLGCLRESLSLQRPQKEGRRAVYLAEFRVRNQTLPIQRFLRLQKWGVWEHLDEGKDLLQAILESDEYTDYSLDRRLGCRQLGMSLCRRVVIRRLNEVYLGTNQRYRGQVIRTTYLERDYVPGIATDKLPLDRYARPGYALALASLLGQTAASSIIVGRSLEDARPAFDDGDEVVLENEDGLPANILVADHSGAFTEYLLPLESFAADYARPVNRRQDLIRDLGEFARLYLAAFEGQFTHVQNDYRKRRRAFDRLFQHCKYDPAGSFAYRWECVLRRLDQTDVATLISAIRRHIQVLTPDAAEPGSLAQG